MVFVFFMCYLDECNCCFVRILFFCLCLVNLFFVKEGYICFFKKLLLFVVLWMGILWVLLLVIFIFLLLCYNLDLFCEIVVIDNDWIWVLLSLMYLL